MATPIDASALLLVLNWMSPAFPTGSFAYSHGLEFAIASGKVTTRDDVEAWIADLLQSGSAWNDAVLFAQCWREDEKKLNELALALAGSSERYLETTNLGRSFAIAASTWTATDVSADAFAYPVIAGMACKSMSIPVEHALIACLQGFCAALVSVAVRLVPLGQTAGLGVLRNLSPLIAATAARAKTASLDDLGSCAIVADIASMRHEVMEPRVFRT
jgi:urease accessory protein